MKLIDVLLFSGEMDILEIRLNIMYPYIDKFIIIESKKTFRNEDKKLYFDKDKYKMYMDKIIYLIIDEFPQFDKLYHNENWSRRCYQTNYMMNGLKMIDLDENDLIIFSDCDEIIKPSVLINLINNNIVEKNQHKILKFVLDLHYYNIFTRGDKWYGALITTYSKMKEMINTRLGMVEDQRRNHGYDKINNAGWHLSYWGSIDDIMFKMTKLADVVSNSKENIINLRKNSKDVLGRGDNNGAGPHNLQCIEPQFNEFEEIIIFNQYNITDRFSKIAYRLKCDNCLKYRISEYYDKKFNNIRLNKINIYCDNNIELFKKYFIYSDFNNNNNYDIAFINNIDKLNSINSNIYVLESDKKIKIDIKYKIEMYSNNNYPIYDNNCFYNFIKNDTFYYEYYLYILYK